MTDVFKVRNENDIPHTFHWAIISLKSVTVARGGFKDGDDHYQQWRYTACLTEEALFDELAEMDAKSETYRVIRVESVNVSKTYAID